MILSYLLRLFCLCFASFFVLNFAASLLVRLCSSSAIRMAESRTPVAAARFLLVLRLLPVALATLFVVGLCVPSYLWLEPAATAERVGGLCAVSGLLGAASWLISIARTAHSLLASLRQNRLCRLAGQETGMPGDASPIILVENEAPLLALSGVLRPRLLISRNVLHALSGEELDAALSHEQAHRTARDNAKRLLLRLAPDIVPFFRTLQTLERNWAKFAEWAADDQAAAGNSGRALSLAAALVRVARMGSAPRLAYLSTSLLACDRDLSDRVDRLLLAIPMTRAHSEPARHRGRTAGFLLTGSLAAILLVPSTLPFVHELLELLLH